MASSDPAVTPDKVVPSPVGTPDQKDSPELPAPPGWHKKVGSSKKGSAKKDVCFIAPDGEEIKSRRLMDRYLKNHSGGPAASEFDWSSGETPTRRSSRLSTKVRPPLDSPKSPSSEKRRKKNVVEEKPKDEEEGEPELHPTDVSTELPTTEMMTEVQDDEPTPSIEQVDEVMNDVKESEKKIVEEVAAEAPSTMQETEPKVETELPSSVEVAPEALQTTVEVVAEVLQDTKEVVVEVAQGAQGNEEHRTEASAENGGETKESAKEIGDLHENNTPLQKEGIAEHKEDSDKTSNVFQHCPEAPNASRQVDVST